MSNYHSEVGGHNDIIFIFIKYHDLKEIHFNFKNYKFDTMTLKGLTLKRALFKRSSLEGCLFARKRFMCLLVYLRIDLVSVESEMPLSPTATG